MYPVIIKKHDGVLVVRDDYIAGGTKRRFIDKLIADTDRELVYASPVYGGAQIAIAHAARDAGILATIFCAERRQTHPRTLAAIAAGANIIQVPHGYLNVVQARARAYVESTPGAQLLPFGLDTPIALEIIAKAAAEAIKQTGPVDEVWCAGGSGVLARGLRAGIPEAALHVVQVGHALALDGATIHVHPLKFEQDAKILPPFPSCSNYDAKVWGILKARAQGRVLFWNVMSNGEPTRG